MNSHSLLTGRHLCISLLTILYVLPIPGALIQSAAASVSANVSIWHGYDFYYPNLSQSSATPAPVTFHWMENASGKLWKQIGDTNGVNAFWITNDLNAVIYECTNGLWKLYLNRGDASEELYYFAMAITGVTTNELGDVDVLSPLSGSTGVSSTPTYEWTGPTNLPNISASSSHATSGNNYGIGLPGTATTWTPGLLTAGTNSLFLNYYSNSFPGITFTTPTNASGTPLAGWEGRGDLHSYISSSFTVAGGGSGGGHTLKAHYSFENGSIMASDYSGNANNIASISSTGGGTRFITNSPALGQYAAYFDNNAGSGGGWLNAPDALLPILAKSFSVSLWLQTTQASGDDDDNGLFGNAGLVGAFTGGGDWVVPMAITGSKLGFATGGTPQHTLHSVMSITNESEFVHLVVTRNQLTGEKKIYINGVLDATGKGSTDLLDSSTGLDIGWSNGTGLRGILDEIQFYEGVLSASEVAFLHANPTGTVPDVFGDGDPELAEALDAPELAWRTGGDANWFLQTEETDDGEDAARSGAIDHDEESWIETTVVGPGYFSFWWKVSSDDSDSYDTLKLTVNGDDEADIAGERGWESYEFYLDEGEHTLRWTYHKDGEITAGQDAAWLDEVVYEQEIDIGISLTIERTSDPGNPGFFAFPSFASHSPEPLTSYEIVSPSGWASCFLDASDDSVSYTTLPTLDEVISELNGDWTLYINRGHPQERRFTFSVTVNDLDVSDLPAINITSPAENATGIATNHTFVWTGPNDFDSLFLYSYMVTNGSASGGFTNLTPSVSSSMMPNPLAPGTNGVYVNYARHGFTGVSISDPVDSSFNSLWAWSSQVDLILSQTRRFEVTAGELPPLIPVQMLDPQPAGSDFSFSLVTQPGRTHTVQSRTNLTTAPWVNVTNIVGDGNLIQIVVPISSNLESYFRVGTQ